MTFAGVQRTRSVSPNLLPSLNQKMYFLPQTLHLIVTSWPAFTGSFEFSMLNVGEQELGALPPKMIEK